MSMSSSSGEYALGSIEVMKAMHASWSPNLPLADIFARAAASPALFMTSRNSQVPPPTSVAAIAQNKGSSPWV